MNDRVSSNQYEEALAEIISIQCADAPVNLGRLEELTAKVEAFEHSVWTEFMFENFDANLMQT
ncbi:MAG: hypothetical protein H8D75_02445 [Rhodospirillaceae bacterium]|nr:hypothetical protein [Rhodospirillaceae bacterium]